jgi:proteasome assembly chaperone (PAC2) family protein
MDEPSPVERVREIDLKRPILIAAFRGWNDAGDSASFAATHLARVWDAEVIARIDPEEFYDFQAVRPQVRLVDGRSRQIEWPSNEFHAARSIGAEHDVLLLIGTEPNLHWRAFTQTVVDEAKRHGVGFVITLGALLADVPHSRPVQITGTAAGDELIERLNLHRSRYEGPTGIVGVLHDAFARAGIESASLWAAVPHYLAVSPNPKAALALVDKTVQLTGLAADVGDLEHAAHNYEERVADIIAADEDVQSYVRLLEDRIDDQTHEEQIDPSQLPSGDALAEELQRYLREQDG